MTIAVAVVEIQGSRLVVKRHMFVLLEVENIFDRCFMFLFRILCSSVLPASYPAADVILYDSLCVKGKV